MRAQIQRVSSASVTVDGEILGAIDQGILAYVGAHGSDTAADVNYIAEKIAGLRIFTDPEGKMNLSVEEVRGAVLVISAFSLYADARKGRRPSFIESAPPERAEPLIAQVVEKLQMRGLRVATGRFRAHMLVSSVNDGPICVPLDSKKQF